MTALLKKNIFKGGFKIYYQVKQQQQQNSHDRDRKDDKVFGDNKQQSWKGSLAYPSAEP